MKREMKYDEFYFICKRMAEQMKKDDITVLVSIARGGISAGHIISKILNLPLGFYYPANAVNQRFLFPHIDSSAVKIGFVEDLIAQGRTFDNVYQYTQESTHDWKFYSVIIDKNFEIPPHATKLIWYGLCPEEWIVFPYESIEAVKEGDRGLFREGTDSYGKM